MARTRTKAVDTENEEATDDTDTEETSASDETGGGGDSGDNGLEGRIREIVREVVGPLLESGNGNGRRAVDDEDETTRKVRLAMAKLKADEDKETRFKKVEDTLQKVTERPPAPGGFFGKLQRAMWGEE